MTKAMLRTSSVRRQPPVADGGALGREVLDDVGDLRGIGSRRVGSAHRLDHAGGGDELHGYVEGVGELHTKVV